LMKLLYSTCEKYGIVCDNDAVFGYMRDFKNVNGLQMELF